MTDDPSWSYDSLLPLFKKSEGFQEPTAKSDYITQSVSDKYHGRQGEWKVSYQSFFHNISSAFIRAAEAVGLTFNPDFNAETTLGVGRIQTFIDPRDSARSSSERAFLSAEVLDRPNLGVVTNAQCLKVIIENGECTGVVILHHGEEKIVRARHEVIVSCGAFDSPRILFESGVQLPGIGQNLQDHIGINISFHIPDSVDKSWKTLDLQNGFFTKFFNLLKFVWYRTGTATTNIGEAVAFYRTKLEHVLKTDPSSGNEGPHVELIAAPGATHHHEGIQIGKRIRPDFDWSLFEFNGRYITIIPLLLTPYSRGKVTFQNNTIQIDPNYFSDQRDLDVMVEAVKFVRQIVREGYPKVLLEGLEEMIPGDDARTDQAIEVFIRDQAETYYHPVGTCKVCHFVSTC